MKIDKKSLAVSEIDHILDNILNEIAEIKLPTGFENFVMFALSELLTNIMQHSQSKKIDISIHITPKTFLLQLADHGIGIKKSYLLNKKYPKDDSAAIQWALSGLSTKDNTERGFGLYSTKKLVEALSGIMIIKSGTTKTTIEKDKISNHSLNKSFKGVSIVIKTKIKKLDFYKFVS